MKLYFVLNSINETVPIGCYLDKLLWGRTGSNCILYQVAGGSRSLHAQYTPTEGGWSPLRPPTHNLVWLRTRGHRFGDRWSNRDRCYLKLWRRGFGFRRSEGNFNFDLGEFRCAHILKWFYQLFGSQQLLEPIYFCII